MKKKSNSHKGKKPTLAQRQTAMRLRMHAKKHQEEFDKWAMERAMELLAIRRSNEKEI